MSRYWISWWQPGDDPRPLNDPPKDQRVIGWWISGEDGEEERTSLCALVCASSEEEAKQAVVVDWPESAEAEWRFLTPKESKWTPGDRFPAKNWMTLRHAARS